MGWRTIIEINHDHLKDAEGEIADLLESLPSHGLSELQKEYRYSNAIRVLGQRDSYKKITLVIE